MTAPDTLPEVSIRLVELDATFELRRDVLRPWLTPETARATYAGSGEHFHVGALMDGRVISTVAFAVEAHPDYSGEFGSVQWRLRGMATFPEHQGAGLGGQVLEFGIEELAKRMGARGEQSAVVWCNGRTGAQRFYERHGFRAIGELFETPGTGPHYVFWRKVTLGSAPSPSR